MCKTSPNDLTNGIVALLVHTFQLINTYNISLQEKKNCPTDLEAMKPASTSERDIVVTLRIDVIT